jgi:transposase
MRRHAWNLKEDQPAKLKSYFARFPALEATYEFKQELVSLLLVKHRPKKRCGPLVRLFLSLKQQLRSSPIPSLKTLGDSIHDWQEEIVRMWRFTKVLHLGSGS